MATKRMKQRWLIRTCLAMLVIAMLFVSVITVSADPGWSKRRLITITNDSGNALTDYQVKVEVTYDSDMQSDFDDLRFTNEANTVGYDYWIESKVDGSSAIVWVKVSSVPPGDSTMYMWYGNPQASSESNGKATFVFFDDFEYTDSPSNHGWTVVQQSSAGIIETSTAYAYNGSRSLRIKTQTGSEQADYVQRTSVPSGIAEVMFYDNMSETTGGQYRMIFKYQGSNACLTGIGRQWGESGGDRYLYRFGDTWYRSDVTRILGWHKFTIKYTGSNYRVYIDDTYIAAGASGTPTSLGFGNWWNWQTYDSGYYDDVRIRKYASPEPTTSVGSEEPVTAITLSSFTARSGNLISQNGFPFLIWLGLVGLAVLGVGGVVWAKRGDLAGRGISKNKERR